MLKLSLQPITSRPPAVIASLTLLAILAFAGVTRLANRFTEQQKALARHLYERAVAEQRAGRPEEAIVHFRGALIYSPDNFEYRLQLARALRDTGRTQEAEDDLISLWERAPQDGAVNLALGRLAVRQNSLDRALQYYHNAIYGVWSSDPDQHRVQAWFELIDFLIRQNARPQAEAELITLAAELPPQAELRLRVADLFARMQDHERALAEYQQEVKIDPENAQALAGAGEMAFQLAQFRTAEDYLQAAATANPQDAQIQRMLEVCQLVMARDPFRRDISMEERNRRLSAVFGDAGKRLDSCMAAQGPVQANGSQPAADLPALKTKWEEMRRTLGRLRSSREADLPDEVMDLVLAIEQQTQACPATTTDEALLLLAQNRRSQP